MALIEIESREVIDLRGALPVRKGAARYPTRPLDGITMAVIHYSGVDADSSAPQIADYQTTKTTGDLFPECAYSFVVRWDGRIEQCHDLEKRTWHAGGRNNDIGIGICLPGNGWPTPEQLESAAALMQALARELGKDGVTLLDSRDAILEGRKTTPLLVVGHKELSATLCPGPHWDAWKQKLAPRTDHSGLRSEPAMLAPQPQALGPEVILGFKQLYDYLGPDKCGAPLSPERYDELGNSTQLFSRCEMRWDKSENRVWVSFSW